MVGGVVGGVVGRVEGRMEGIVVSSSGWSGG